MRFLPRLMGALALLAALPLGAETRVRLDEPLDGAVLRGGETATIAWSGDMPRFAEEWEAFLSADGGRHYAYRITPHLDLDRRRFTFEVPNVETGDARILIRAGDERREIELEVAAKFAISQDRLKAAEGGAATLVENDRGEPAREGEAGVIEWVDGDRDGHHLRPRSALRHDLAIQPTPRLDAGADSVEAAGPPLLLLLVLERRPESPQQRTPAATPYGTRPPAARDVLLASRRLNL